MSSKVIGYIVGTYDPITVCVDCSTTQNGDEIENNDVYGNDIPYPECYTCGEVMRPERFE